MVSGDQPTLSKTDPFPTKETEGLRLYSGRFCPFAHRTRLVLNAKEIPYEIVNVDLREKPDWYKDISPLGKVPLLEETESRRIVESLVIAEYLDDAYHDARPLLPTDALGRAKQKMLVEVISSKYAKLTVAGILREITKTFRTEEMTAFMGPSRIGQARSGYPIFRSLTGEGPITAPHQQVVLKGEQENKDALLKALDDVEGMMVKPFMAGEQLGFVDLMVWPWFERLPAIEQHRQMSFPAERYPKITAWCQRMRDDPAVKATAQPTEIYSEFYKTRNPNVGL